MYRIQTIKLASSTSFKNKLISPRTLALTPRRQTQCSAPLSKEYVFPRSIAKLRRGKALTMNALKGGTPFMFPKEALRIGIELLQSKRQPIQLILKQSPPFCRWLPRPTRLLSSRLVSSLVMPSYRTKSAELWRSSGKQQALLSKMSSMQPFLPSTMNVDRMSQGNSEWKSCQKLV